jgi:hypothetical protein
MRTEATIDPELISQLDLSDLSTRVLALDSDARTGFLILMDRALRTLENQAGCMLALVDVEGDGSLAMLALGNSLLSTPILGAAAGLYETFHEHEGPLQ